MKHILLLIVAAGSLIFTQDDFFQPSSSIGGYGELHYNRAQTSDDDATTTLDFHRFIIYYGYNWTEKLVLQIGS